MTLYGTVRSGAALYSVPGVMDDPVTGKEGSACTGALLLGRSGDTPGCSRACCVRWEKRRGDATVRIGEEGLGQDIRWVPVSRDVLHLHVFLSYVVV